MAVMTEDQYKQDLALLVGGENPVRLNHDQWEAFWRLVNAAKSQVKEPPIESTNVEPCWWNCLTQEEELAGEYIQVRSTSEQDVDRLGIAIDTIRQERSHMPGVRKITLGLYARQERLTDLKNFFGVRTNLSAIQRLIVFGLNVRANEIFEGAEKVVPKDDYFKQQEQE